MKLHRLIFMLICMMSLALPLAAQEEEATEEPVVNIYDCTPTGINRQVDAWYNEYLSDRGQVDEAQAIAAAQTFADNLDDITTVCSTEAEATEMEEDIPQTGIGSIDSPFIIQAPGVVGDSTLDITQSILPADEVIIEGGYTSAEFIPEGQEYLLLSVTLTCAQGSTTGCEVSENAFRIVGDMGELYFPTLGQIDDYFPNSRRVNGGSERSGVIPFLVNQDDTSLKLVYFPNGDAFTDGAFATYFVAQGSPNTFSVNATIPELLIRQRPVSGAVIGVLRDGQTGEASARNVDGTWIFVEAPEGIGWVSAEFLTSDSDLSSLSVIDPDE